MSFTFKRLMLAASLLFALAALPARALAASEGTDPGKDHPAGQVTAKAHGDAGGEEHAGPLMPANGEEAKEVLPTAIWVIVIFVLLLLILYPTAWKNVLGGLKAREQRIRNDIAEAEAARAKADATLKEYNARLAAAEQQVRDMIAKAAADAEQIATGIRTRAQQDRKRPRSGPPATSKRPADRPSPRSTSRPPTWPRASPRSILAAASIPTTARRWSSAASTKFGR